MTTVHITSTPYHLLLSTGVAMANETQLKRDLIILKNYPESNKIIEAVRNWNKNPFNKCSLLPGDFSKEKTTNRLETLRNPNSHFNIVRKNLKYIKSNYKSKLENVYVHNTRKAECQLLMYLNSKDSGLNTYLEDGMGVYTQNRGRLPIDKYLKRKIKFGPWYKNSKCIGGGPYTDEIMVLRPDLLDISKPCFDGKSIEEIPIEVLKKLKQDGLLDSIVENFNFKINEIKNLVILPHSSFLTGIKNQSDNNLFEKYLEVFDIFSKKFDKITMKYHPREKKKYLAKVPSSVTNLPQTIPIEIVYFYLMSSEPKYIIGDISTALLTAKLLFEDTKVISLVKLYDIKDYRVSLESIFEKVGILMPKDVYELNQILNQDI